MGLDLISSRPNPAAAWKESFLGPDAWRPNDSTEMGRLSCSRNTKAHPTVIRHSRFKRRPLVLFLQSLHRRRCVLGHSRRFFLFQQNCVAAAPCLDDCSNGTNPIVPLPLISILTCCSYLSSWWWIPSSISSLLFFYLFLLFLFSRCLLHLAFFFFFFCDTQHELSTLIGPSGMIAKLLWGVAVWCSDMNRPWWSLSGFSFLLVGLEFGILSNIWFPSKSRRNTLFFFIHPIFQLA